MLPAMTVALTAMAASATATKASASRRASCPIPKICRLRTQGSARPRPRDSGPRSDLSQPRTGLAQAAGGAISDIRALREPVGAYGLLTAAADSVRASLDPVDGVLDQGEIFMCPEHASHQPRLAASKLTRAVGHRSGRHLIVIGHGQHDNLVDLLPPQLFERGAVATRIHDLRKAGADAVRMGRLWSPDGNFSTPPWAAGSRPAFTRRARSRCSCGRDGRARA